MTGILDLYLYSTFLVFLSCHEDKTEFRCVSSVSLSFCLLCVLPRLSRVYQEGVAVSSLPWAVITGADGTDHQLGRCLFKLWPYPLML